MIIAFTFASKFWTFVWHVHVSVPLEVQDQFVLAMTYKLCVYALGRPLRFSDHAAVEAIASQVRQQGDGLASLIQLIGTSELFLSP